jgi:hypothetical protein
MAGVFISSLRSVVMPGVRRLAFNPDMKPCAHEKKANSHKSGSSLYSAANSPQLDVPAPRQDVSLLAPCGRHIKKRPRVAAKRQRQRRLIKVFISTSRMVRGRHTAREAGARGGVAGASDQDRMRRLPWYEMFNSDIIKALFERGRRWRAWGTNIARKTSAWWSLNGHSDRVGAQ